MSYLIRFLLTCVLLVPSLALSAVGKVSLLKGEAFVLRNAQNMPLQNGSLLEEKDAIKTGKDAQIQLIFEDKTVVTLGSESEFKIEEYLNTPSAPKSKFKFTQGTFKTITGTIGKIAPENVTLETKTATIGIRGTIVAGQIGENADIIGCLQGVIEVMSLTGGTGVIVKEGQQTTVEEGTPPQTPKELEGGGNPQNPDNTPPADETPQSADDASQTNLQDTVLKDVEDKVQSSTCPAGSVGTPPRCQTINTSYELPDYWTANLNAASTNEQKTLSGYATGAYFDSGTHTFMDDGTLFLVIDGSTETVPLIAGSKIYFANANYTINLNKVTNSSETLTYKNINEFSVKNFEIGENGWIQSENTHSNQYVSWGYWQYNENNQNDLLPGLNFWVAGVNTEDAKNHILSLEGTAPTPTTTYAYTGQSIGYVYDSTSGTYTGIDTVNNNIVSLQFDFGGGTSSLKDTSYIQFQTNGTTPEVWKFNSLSGGVGIVGTSKTFDGSSSISINGAVVDDAQANIKGTFYGNAAQAVGGTFKAPANTKTAIGVFKAVR